MLPHFPHDVFGRDACLGAAGLGVRVLGFGVGILRLLKISSLRLHSSASAFHVNIAASQK